MKEYLSAFCRLINISQVFFSLCIQLLANLKYTVGRPPDQFYIFYKDLSDISFKNILPNLSRIINNCLLSYHHIFSIILIKANLLCSQKRVCVIICVHKFLRVFAIKLGEILNSSLIKRISERNILKSKRVSILVIFIFVIPILSDNVNYDHRVNSIYNDGCPFCNTACSKANDDSNLSIYDVYQLPSNGQIVFKPSTKKVFITPYILSYRISTRSPPV